MDVATLVAQSNYSTAASQLSNDTHIIFMTSSRRETGGSSFSCTLALALVTINSELSREPRKVAKEIPSVVFLGARHLAQESNLGSPKQRNLTRKPMPVQGEMKQSRVGNRSPGHQRTPCNGYYPSSTSRFTTTCA